ncbi:hypothetical protein JCM10207_000008 [Rhodosporidiobolus poonsookiae]
MHRWLRSSGRTAAHDLLLLTLQIRSSPPLSASIHGCVLAVFPVSTKPSVGPLTRLLGADPAAADRPLPSSSPPRSQARAHVPMAPLTSSPSSVSSPLPSPSPPASPAGGALAPGSSAASTSSSGSGRGRRVAPSRGSSVQARRSAASLGLGVHFANMNELAAPSPSTPSSSLSPSRSSTSPGGSQSTSPSPSRAYSPPSSRRSSLTAAVHAAPFTPSSSGPPPGFGYTTSTPLSALPEDGPPPTSSSSSRAPSRRPSLTHLASFLSGITHHTRVRSPGVHGGRGVSRSASRSQSRAGMDRRRYGSGGESDAGSVSGGSGGDGEGGEESDDDGAGSEVSFFGGFGGGGSASRSRAGSRRRRTTTASSGGAAGSLSRASSVRSGRSRASSISVASASTTMHPLLHELVRENTTGGDVPSSGDGAATATATAGLPNDGPNVVAGGAGATAAGTVKPATWEATFEAYKPSVVTVPVARVHPPPPPTHTVPDEEPFLDSAPNSPDLAHARIPQRTQTYSSLARTSSFASTAPSDADDLSLVDVFDEGERIGVDVWLEGRGGWVRDCFAGRADVDGKAPGNGLDGPKQLEVERRLGEGTYAIVYLVREVLYDPDPNDDDLLSPIDPLASFEFDDAPSSTSRPRLHSWASEYESSVAAQAKPTYGQYYALKCLCKKNLTEDLIEVQRNEAFLHRALPKHENIVQMYGAYETDDWLFLVLEYAGGRDAFYWLLEAQEHGTEDLYSRAASPNGDYLDALGRRRSSFDFDSTAQDDEADDSALSRTITADTPAHLLVDETPPSPSLLSAAVGDALLSRKRLRLISRMFGQMCAAVQACHDVGISHRDIKPENFIVIDGKPDRGATGAGREVVGMNGAPKGVVVKITDWGLGTMEALCEDFDCGSKPYMAYECRNNLRPTYDPRQADVWSLGLVFLNLLYHRNPWADPSLSDPDFSEYVDDPVGFLQNRFEGMSDEVATFLAERVFCDVLEVVDGQPRRRVSAGDFGRWASRLVVMMGEGSSSPFSLGGRYSRPPFSSELDSYSSNYDFSPVATMPLHIPGAGGMQPSPTPGAANLPPGASLLSQHFAPSTLRASTVFDDLGSDLRSELPTVPEIPDIPSRPPTRPAFITSPTALSEDGDSLPSPTFPSPPVPMAASPEAIYSPLPPSATLIPAALPSPRLDGERTFVRMPWSTPSPAASPALSPNGTGARTPASPGPAAEQASVSSASPLPQPAAPPVASGISLLAARRPSLLDAQNDSMLSNASTVVPPAEAASPELVPSPSGLVNGSSEHAEREGDDKKGSSDEGNGDKDGKDGEKQKSKRRKRGARKEKRAAREQAKAAAATVYGETSPPLLASPRSGRLGSLEEGGGRDRVLDDLAAASQELARELSTAKSTTSSSSARPTRPRPIPSSGSHGTKSTSALPQSMSTGSASAGSTGSYVPPLPGKKASGMFGRLKTLVNEGNPDLEAFKRRVDERNASIGATSAPAKMQHQSAPGSRVPKGKYDSPFSSRGSVGKESWGSGIEGGDELAGAGGAARGRADKDHWSSASSRRDRLADRRQIKPKHAAPESEFSPSSSSTRGLGSAFGNGTASSTTQTPLSSFGSVGGGAGGTGEFWRSGSHSRSRVEGLAPALPVSPTSPTSKPVRPKLKDASTDTSDLGSGFGLASPPVSPPLPSQLSTPTLAPASAPAATVAKSSPRPLAPSIPSAPSASPVVASPTPPGGTPQKGNKLAKMLNSISVFNRQQPGAASPGPEVR